MIRELTREDCTALLTLFKKKRGELVRSSDERYVLTKPQNTWDTNYHLIDRHNNVEHLVDIDDIGFNDYNSYNDYELEDIIIFYSDMLDIDNNLDMIIETSWKVNIITD